MLCDRLIMSNIIISTSSVANSFIYIITTVVIDLKTFSMILTWSNLKIKSVM